MIQATTNNTDWVDIIGFIGIYQVSQYGQVRRIYKNKKIKILKQSLTSSGYLSVGLCLNNKSKTTHVHSLVAKHFINKVGDVVNHIDSNKLNNSVSNLEWVTVRENTTHSMKLNSKTSNYVGVSWHKLRQKWHSYSSLNSKKIYLGYFNDEKAAYNAKLLFEGNNGIKNKYA
jgi:hypothetical protein